MVLAALAMDALVSSNASVFPKLAKERRSSAKVRCAVVLWTSSALQWRPFEHVTMLAFEGASNVDIYFLGCVYIYEEGSRLR